MKTLKVLLQEVVSGIKAWVNSNFAQESNTVHKTGNETVNGVKTFTSTSTYNDVCPYCKNTSISGKLTPEVTTSIQTVVVGNSNMWYGNQTYILDANGECYWRWNAGSFRASDQGQGIWGFDFGVKRDFSAVFLRPQFNNSYFLGESDHQWWAVYAKNYYYNGTEFQNKFVTTDTDQVVPNLKRFKKVRFSSDNTIDITQTSYSDTINVGGYSFSDNAIKFWGNVELNILPDATSEMKFNLSNWKANGTQGVTSLAFRYSKNLGRASFTCPDKVSDLGTTDRKWKTLNGINPGALSLPKTASSNLDTTNWNLRGGLICSLIPSIDGYINVQIKRNVDFSVWTISAGRQNFRSSLMPEGFYAVMVWSPCRAGFRFEIYSVPLIDSPAEQREDDLIIQVAKIWPAEGNV